MRVGIFLKEIPADLGGAFTFIETVLSSLKKSDHIEWTVFYYGKRPTTIQSQTVQFVRLGGSGFSRKIGQLYYSFIRNQIHHRTSKLERLFRRKLFFPYGSRLDCAVQKFDIDLVWFLSPEYEWVDRPYIATVWDLEHRAQPYFPEVSERGEWQAREKYFRTLLPRASYVITGTQVGRDEIVRHYGVSPERIRILPHPTPQFALINYPKYDLPKSLRSLDQSPPIQMPYILYPAQFWAHKNHVGLLKSVKWIHQNSALKPHIVLVGSDKGNKHHVVKVAKDLGLTSYTRFMGFVSREELVALYQNAAVTAYPSLCGPENLPPLEAMAFGVPVVAADIPGAREQLGNHALLAEALKPEVFGKAILSILQDDVLRKSLIETGLKRAKSYTAHEFSLNLLNIVEEFSLIRGLSR